MPKKYKTLVELFEENVKKSPANTAVISDDIKLTYGELNQKANQVAYWLQYQGINKGDTVALFFNPSIEFIVCIVAIIKIGAVYVPLDTKAPLQRIKYIVNNADPKIIITNQVNFKYPNLPVHQVEEITINNHFKAELIDYISINSEDPACIFYTSGSTGKPKGVVIPHRAIINLSYQPNLVNIHSSDVIAQFSNIAFDAIILELWSALLNGATLLNIPYLIRQDHFKLREIFSNKQIDFIFFPTAYFHQMIRLYPDLFDNLSTIILGGDQVNVTLIKTFLNYRKSQCKPITLINGYGPTEATACTCFHKIQIDVDNDEQIASIGKPINNVKVYILNENLVPVEDGEAGELYIAGLNLAIGYNKSPLLNQKKFIDNPFDSTEPFKLLYRTGDKGRQLADGNLLYLGRIDDQVKINGYRMHLHEIENQLLRHPNIASAAVLVESKGNKTYDLLTAYIVFKSPDKLNNIDEIRSFLARFLPSYMLPGKFIKLEEMPLNNNGKIDKNKLLSFSQDNLEILGKNDFSSNTLNALTAIFTQLLNRNNIEIDRNLFELGANSLIITEACFRINKELACSIQISDILTYPSIYKLSRHIENNPVSITPNANKTKELDIAIIGMSCRFPQANSLHQYWTNLCEGKDCLTNFEKHSLTEIDSEKNEHFVPVRGIIENIDKFDAHFFNFDPADASITDPQQRIFLECAWEALEHSGNTPDKNNLKIISIFSGMSDSTYLQMNLLKSSWFNQQYDSFNARIATSIGTLSTQVSYRLNLNGKSINVNTACSTSLVAVEQACQDLVLGYSDIALAGGVSIDLNKMQGYYYQQGGIESKDGICRPFDKEASGTVFSDGAGVVVLKKLSDAIKDNDTIYAVIKGCGINNDGADKLGYSAPSTNGQIHCINMALNQANISVEDITFIETHGTATELGDVIEFTALNKVYRQNTNNKRYCALGAVKGNIGHSDVAAGMAGLIKTVLCLYYKKIPPTLYFNQSNSNINLSDSPFYINSKLLEWENSEKPRFAGVSAFGIGGTNVHLILSEYKQLPSQPSLLQNKLVILSTKTKKALEKSTHEVINYLTEDQNGNSSTHLYDFAYTLQTGRDDFQYRRFAVGRTKQEIIDNLAHSFINYNNFGEQCPIVFMFSGQGTQYLEMAMQLFDTIDYFASLVIECSRIAKYYLGCDIITIIRNDNNAINQTKYTQIALFIIEYSLAKLLMYYGVSPNAMIGHSSGEYVAACIAKVFSLDDTIKLICQRGALMAAAPTGTMLSIECTLNEFYKLKGDITVDLALHNSINSCVVSGDFESIQKFQDILIKNSIIYQKLKVSHAFHSYLMEDVCQQFYNCFADIVISAPQIPIISNVTGTWASPQEITNPNYWVRHLRQTVQFKNGIETLVKAGYKCFVEIGPGATLSSFTQDITHNIDQRLCITNILPNHKRLTSDESQLLTTIGKLWQYGVKINWSAFYGDERRMHVSLPTYAFQRQRYWVEPDLNQVAISTKKLDIDDWFYQPTWTSKLTYQVLEENSIYIKNYSWIIFIAKNNLDKEIIAKLRKCKAQLIMVEENSEYIQLDSDSYAINFFEKLHYDKLFTAVKKQLDKPILILHLLSYSDKDINSHILSEQNINPIIDKALNNTFYSLLYMTQAFIETIGIDNDLKCAIVTNNSQKVLGTELINPINACLTGICRVIPQEHSFLKFKLIDLDVENRVKPKHLSTAIINTCLQDEWNTVNPIMALRNNNLWQLGYSSIKLKQKTYRLKNKGIYLLTGGLGGINLTLSQIIAKTVIAPVLILLSRTEFPHRSDWEKILNDSKSTKIHNKIRSLQELLKLGAIIHIEKADITDLKSLKETISKISCYGKINGVIHAAGVAGGGLAQLKTKEIADKVFAPKLLGTYNLAKALNNCSLDFVVFCSSISALIGEQGQVDYCAANACLDAFAASDIFNSKYITSINWNTWQEVGMTVETERPVDISFLDRGNDISPKQGQELFMKILQSNYTQVAISTFDINAFSMMVSHKTLPQTFSNITREDLNINSNYVAPNSSIEKQLVQLWQEILGIEQIGIEDDFFTIGGHSLKALRLLEAVQKKLNYAISVKDVYENKTIAKLARKLANLEVTNLPQEILFPLKIHDEISPIIFMFHPLGGTIFCYQNLMDIWDFPFSVCGIQDPSISVGQIMYSSILEMANSYYQEIKKLQPTGPYYLMGYSFGGAIAYEVANLLQHNGEKVNFLGMIDSWTKIPPTYFDESKFKFSLNEKNPGISEFMLDLAWERVKLLKLYIPTPSNIDITFFRATLLLEEYEEIADQYNGWKEYCDGHISVYPIDANHDSILLKNHVTTIFIILKKILADFKCSKKKFFENINNQALLSTKHSNTGQIHSSLDKIMI